VDPAGAAGWGSRANDGPRLGVSICEGERRGEGAAEAERAARSVAALRPACCHHERRGGVTKAVMSVTRAVFVVAVAARSGWLAVGALGRRTRESSSNGAASDYRPA